MIYIVGKCLTGTIQNDCVHADSCYFVVKESLETGCVCTSGWGGYLCDGAASKPFHWYWIVVGAGTGLVIVVVIPVAVYICRRRRSNYEAVKSM